MQTLALPILAPPPCRHRGPERDGWYDCALAQGPDARIIAPHGVTAVICKACSYCDKEVGPMPELPPTPVQPKCPQLWKRVRDEEGTIRLKTVATTCCGDKQLDLFECRHPARKAASGQNDEITLNDCQTCDYRPKQLAESPRVLILKNDLSPGDVLVMTAAVHSLHKHHPGKYVTAIQTTADAFWENNPDVIPVEQAIEQGGEEVVMHYPLINESNQRAVHFMQGYCDFLAHALKVPVPLLTNRPTIYLSRAEKEWLPQVQEITGRPTRYWVVCAGRKSCYTAKFWGSENYQKVVDLLRGRVLFVQVGAAEHHHPPLKNVINLVGRTDQRQLVRLVHHSDGVLCGVTLLHHLAAALQKPSVVVAGGREAVQWNSYPFAHLLHTVGLLPCCRDESCGKSRTVPLGDGDEKDKPENLCSDPVWGEEPVPRCLSLTTPDEVAQKLTLISHYGHP